MTATMPNSDSIAVSTLLLESGIELEYATKAGGDHTILFIHGYIDSWYSFSGVMNALSDDWTTVAVSLRGHGGSTKTCFNYSIADHVDDLVAFAQRLCIRSALVVGHSMGTFIAREFALRRPDLVRGLVLVGSAATADNIVLRSLRSDIANLNDPIPRVFVHDFQAGTCVNPPSGGMTIQKIVDESLKVPIHVWREALDGLIAYRSRDDLVSELACISAPTLVIWGALDEIFPRVQQDILVRGIPTSQLLIFDQAGHAPNWEQPKELARAIMDFELGSNKF